MRKFAQNLIADESGQDLIEYALLAALVGLGSIAATNKLAQAVDNTFGFIGNSLHENCAPGMSCIGG
jgi:pilus assembly protein Flp/PilA